MTKLIIKNKDNLFKFTYNVATFYKQVVFDTTHKNEEEKDMKLKKLCSILLVGAMSAALLAGCGGAATEEESGAAGGAVSAGGEEEEAAFTGFEETETIDMYGLSFFGDGGLTEVMDAINAISEEQINVHVNYTPMDVATYMEQIGLMLSGGESFDLVMATAIPVVSFSTMQSQNQLTDITEYLDYYAPEMTEMMSEYLDATTVDGAIYGVPCYRIYNSSYYIIMRQDILDELGLTEEAKAIDSWSDYKAILEQVKDAQDSLPEEMQTNAVLSNQDAQGTVFTGMYSDIAADDFAGDYGFDALSDTNKIICVDETGTVQNYFATEDYKATIERAHEWYEEGLIYKDAATSSDTGDTLMMNGVTFSYVVTSEIGVESAKSSTTGYPVIAVEIHEIPIQTSVGNQWAWCVPTTSEHPEAAVAFMNLMYTNAEIENLFVYGIEGRDYDVVDGEAVLREDLSYQCSDFFFGNQFLAYPGQGTGSDFRDVAMASMEAAEISDYYGCTVNTDPIANELTAVSNVLNKYEAGLESGTTDPSTLDTMLSELESSGMPTILEYYQEQLDAWLAEQ